MVRDLLLTVTHFDADSFRLRSRYLDQSAMFSAPDAAEMAARPVVVFEPVTVALPPGVADRFDQLDDVPLVALGPFDGELTAAE
ncbi:hypothetical protein C437_15306 [Haloarcula vallismortis ATCC 29715]|uniref:Uncharacterized protein n=1 Tax=Haloarcula vallismortis ATCC 29715 TaxID=662477 RepID=M0J192_HALVA|nr:hypothetical protein C437_15306 [Haloarcula vallismortis ATCC 29715]